MMQFTTTQPIKDITNNTPKFTVIAAIDINGGYAKDNEIPWKYKQDMKWFKQQTTGHVCIMGRTTYEEINTKMGDKGKESVLPDRQCFVVSSTLTELPNATVIKSIRDYQQHVAVDDPRIIFIIGGYRLFVEGLALANNVVLTAINRDYNCNKSFPVQYLQKHFAVVETIKCDDSDPCDELRFINWRRHGY